MRVAWMSLMFTPFKPFHPSTNEEFMMKVALKVQAFGNLVRGKRIALSTALIQGPFERCY